MSKWLDIIGIGESGLDSLTPQARRAIEKSEIILGSLRHCERVSPLKAKIVLWPSPFNLMLKVLNTYRKQSKRVCVLVTGDPLWYSAGVKIADAFPTSEITIHPQLSSFQLASSKMGWSLSDCSTCTIHGRPIESLLQHFFPRNKILVLTQGAKCPSSVAKLLCSHGFSNSKLSVLSDLGGSHESRHNGIASSWHHKSPKFHVLAIECRPSSDSHSDIEWYSTISGLPDSAFLHDGQITKQSIRSITLSHLSPFPNAILWDIGAGCGSISIEWARSSRNTSAIAIEFNKKRIGLIESNISKFGIDRLHIHPHKAPKKLESLPRPDSIFIGGGLTDKGVFPSLWRHLSSGGKLVSNAVTLESEVYLSELQSKHGGTLTRLQVQESDTLGDKQSWRPHRQITQWSVTK